MPLVLHGYRYSVYLRIVRLTLAEKGVAYERVEVNPFAYVRLRGLPYASCVLLVMNPGMLRTTPCRS